VDITTNFADLIGKSDRNVLFMVSTVAWLIIQHSELDTIYFSDKHDNQWIDSVRYSGTEAMPPYIGQKTSLHAFAEFLVTEEQQSDGSSQ
jgi:hypothetical protein